MGRLDDLKRLGSVTAAKIGDPEARAEMGRAAAKAAGDAVVAASGALEGAEAVAQRSGLTNRKGGVSKIKLAKALTQPVKSGRTLLTATAEEVNHRRASARPEDAPAQEGSGSGTDG